MPLSKRLESFRDDVVSPLRQRYPNEEDLPFAIMGKEYVQMENMAVLLNRITKHFESDVEAPRFLYKNGKRYNENKGLVFVSESSFYHPSGRLEWLWPELFPVVLHLRVVDQKTFALSLTITPDGEDLVPYREALFESDLSRLLADLNGATEAKICCVHSLGEFRYLHLVSSAVSVSSAVQVLQYLEEVTMTVSKSDLLQLAERTKARLRGSSISPNSFSPVSKLSPTTNHSPETVYESPVEASRKRTVDVVDSVFPGNKRAKLVPLSVTL